jgi:hypothetical protein
MSNSPTELKKVIRILSHKNKILKKKITEQNELISRISPSRHLSPNNPSGKSTMTPVVFDTKTTSQEVFPQKIAKDLETEENLELVFQDRNQRPSTTQKPDSSPKNPPPLTQESAKIEIKNTKTTQQQQLKQQKLKNLQPSLFLVKAQKKQNSNHLTENKQQQTIASRTQQYPRNKDSPKPTTPLEDSENDEDPCYISFIFEKSFRITKEISDEIKNQNPDIKEIYTRSSRKRNECKFKIPGEDYDAFLEENEGKTRILNWQHEPVYFKIEKSLFWGKREKEAKVT